MQNTTLSFGTGLNCPSALYWYRVSNDINLALHYLDQTEQTTFTVHKQCTTTLHMTSTSEVISQRFLYTQLQKNVYANTKISTSGA